MNKIFLISMLFLLVVLTGCKNENQSSSREESKLVKNDSALARLPDTKAGEVVKKAIDLAGGMEKWEQKKTLSYNKIIKFYDSTGNKIREVNQFHEYRLQPELKIKISWEENGDKYAIINNGSQAWKLKNNEVMTAEIDKNAAWNSSFGSHYVATMPFKLTDPGTNLEYMGIDTLNSGQAAHNIKTTYSPDAGSAGGNHTWWYFFDRDNYKPLANFLDYGEGYSYIQNDSFTEVEGIKLQHKRQSFQTNAQMELLYLTTDYLYENYVFDKEFPEGYFEVNK